MTKDTMIGVDLAKSVFQLHAASMTGQPKFRKKLSRQNFGKFMAEQAPAVVVMEACGSAHYWAREMVRLGHEVRLIAPHYVKPFVKRQKNDAADTEAIVIAAQRPEMRFVERKSEEQQSRAILFRARERLVNQRTELVNALRACLYEYGHVVPQGMRQVRRIEEILDTPNSDLPELMREECRDLLEQLREKTLRIDARTKKIKDLAAKTDTARRLQTIPGVGPLTALAVEAFAPPMESFRCGRDFAAWLGLVPRQFSSGGKERLGRISKAGQADIRRLLIIGAMSRLNWIGRRSIPEGSWLASMRPEEITFADYDRPDADGEPQETCGSPAGVGFRSCPIWAEFPLDSRLTGIQVQTVLTLRGAEKRAKDGRVIERRTALRATVPVENAADLRGKLRP